MFRQDSLIRFHDAVLRGRSTFKYLSQLERTQWLSGAELEQLQFDALRRLLQNAYENSPYYREAWQKAGLAPDKLQDPADLRRWPIIDRQTIRDNRLAMRSRIAGLRLISKATGGSSGAPLQFDLNIDSNDRRMAAAHRGYGWAGAEPGTKQVYLWGVPLGSRSWRRRWKERLYNALQRRHVLNCFDYRDDRAKEFNALIKRARPDAIVAYVNPLYAFARALDAQGLQPYKPRAIVVGAEKLHDFQREFIERVFQAPVFETYGSREFMLMGAECDRHEGLHLTMEHLLVEVLDDEGRPAPDGEEGDVVVTDLYNYGMPFIRYANGDRATAGWGRCACGRGLPTLKKVLGRRLDMLMPPDGRQIPGEFFPHLIKEFDTVRRFQVVQHAPGEIEMRLVVAPGWTAAERRRLEQEVHSVVGPAVELRLLLVEAIPLSKAGKLQVVVSKCLDRSQQPQAAVDNC